MNPTFTQQQKIDAYRKLSEEKKAATFSETVADKIELVANKHDLDAPSSLAFKHLIGTYIIGLITIDTLFQTIKDTEICKDISDIIVPEIEKVIKEYKPESEDMDEDEEGNPIGPEIPPMVAPLPTTSSAPAGPSRLEILRQIEDPAISPKSFMEEKLSKPVFVPKETKTITVETPKTPTPSQYGAKDPYREAIE